MTMTKVNIMKSKILQERMQMKEILLDMQAKLSKTSFTRAQFVTRKALLANWRVLLVSSA